MEKARQDIKSLQNRLRLVIQPYSRVLLSDEQRNAINIKLNIEQSLRFFYYNSVICLLEMMLMKGSVEDAIRFHKNSIDTFNNQIVFYYAYYQFLTNLGKELNLATIAGVKNQSAFLAGDHPWIKQSNIIQSVIRRIQYFQHKIQVSKDVLPDLQQIITTFESYGNLNQQYNICVGAMKHIEIILQVTRNSITQRIPHHVFEQIAVKARLSPQVIEDPLHIVPYYRTYELIQQAHAIRSVYLNLLVTLQYPSDKKKLEVLIHHGLRNIETTFLKEQANFHFTSIYNKTYWDMELPNSLLRVKTAYETPSQFAQEIGFTYMRAPATELEFAADLARKVLAKPITPATTHVLLEAPFMLPLLNSGHPVAMNFYRTLHARKDNVAFHAFQ
jgi:hypothetical protein